LGYQVSSFQEKNCGLKSLIIQQNHLLNQMEQKLHSTKLL